MNIKVFCPMCMHYILRTSGAFVAGGPYDGSMFMIPPDKPDAANYFPFETWVTEGNLLCPMCDQQFVTPEGNLLTEHGLVKPGQVSIDTTLSVIYPDNMLMSDSTFSREVREGDISRETVVTPEPEPEVPEEVDDEPEVDEDVIPVSDGFTCRKCGNTMPHPWSHRKGCD